MTVENISIDVKTNAGSAAKQFRSLSSALSGVQSTGQKATSGFTGVGNSAKRATKHTNDFASSLLRIAKYRVMRTIIKEITQGFNEGLKNAYHFSKGLNGSLAASLDGLSTKSLTMKNQMGAAFGALLQAIMPVVLQIISLITRLMQALSALFAAIGGGQYLVAKDVAKGWDEASGAAKEYKKTLLGFDEINRLDDPNSGGGGAADDWANMFDERELPKWAQWIKDHLDEIKKAVEAIGLAIAAWKLASVLADLAGVSLGFSKLLGIAMAVAGAFLLVDGAIDAFTNGTTWKNVNEMLIGTALLASGLALAFGSVGAAIGLLVGGFTLLTAGIADWIRKGELTNESLYAIEGGLLAVGVGISLLTGTWIPLLIAGLAGVLIAIATRAKQINKAVDEFFENTIKGINDFIEKVEEKTGLNLDWLKESITYTLNFLRFYIEGVVWKISWIIDDVCKAIKAAIDGDWDSAWKYAQQAVRDASIDVTEHAVNMAKEVTQSMMSGEETTEDFGAKFEEVMQNARTEADTTKGVVTDFSAAIESAFPGASSAVSGFASDFSGAASSIARDTNWLSDSITDVLGKLASLNTSFAAAHSNIAQYQNDYGIMGEMVRGAELGAWATGGFPSEGEVFIAREAGPELVGTINGYTAVANNDQIVEAVASGVYEAVSSAMSNTNERPMQVRVYLDNREIRTGQNRYARAMGV